MEWRLTAKLRLTVCRKPMRPVAVIILTFALLASVSCAAPPNSDWKMYSGAWFDISFPPTFKAMPLQRSATHIRGYDSAKFVSPSGDIEFYVYSPPSGGRASALEVDPRHEHIT